MSKRLHIIYIPGFSKGDYFGQRQVIGWWRFLGVEAELFPSNWNDRKTWSSKRNAILKRVDALASDNKKVALVGISAGASAAINIYAARKNVIAGVVCIAGWVNQPEDIHPAHLKVNPAFVASAQQAVASLGSLNSKERSRILSRYALIDNYVSKKHSLIKGAHNRMVPSIGHVFTIATQIIFGAPSFIHFLKRQTIK